MTEDRSLREDYRPEGATVSLSVVDCLLFRCHELGRWGPDLEGPTPLSVQELLTIRARQTLIRLPLSRLRMCLQVQWR